MDCGHGGLCHFCALEILQKTGECYLCRKAIRRVLKLDIDDNQGKILTVKNSAKVVEEI